MAQAKRNLKAAQSEAEDSPHIVKIRGEDFAFRRLKDWPAKCFDMLQDGRVYEAVTRGLADYDVDLERLDALWPSLGDLEGVFTDVQEAEGIQGNS